MKSQEVKGIKIIEFDLAITLFEFIELFWNSWTYHEEFVEKVVYETVLSKDDWKNDNNDNEENEKKDQSIKIVSYSRVLNSNHPLPISLPWLPVYVSNKLKQTLKVSYCDNNNNNYGNFLNVEIIEKSVVDGIPLIDPPKVCTHWSIKEFVDEYDENMLNIKIHLYFEDSNAFNIITPLVELHSKNELTSYYHYWKESANFYIIERENEKIFTDSDSKEKKISNITCKDNENPNLNEVYDIINKMQVSNSCKIQKRKLIIHDTAHNGSLCFSKSNSSLFSSCASEQIEQQQQQQRNQGGIFQFFNFFCS